MSKEKNEINVLDELNKGACMGRDAIAFIIDKVKDVDFVISGSFICMSANYQEKINELKKLWNFIVFILLIYQK